MKTKKPAFDCALKGIDDTYMSIADISLTCGINQNAIYKHTVANRIKRTEFLRKKKIAEIWHLRNRGYSKKDIYKIIKCQSRAIQKFIKTISFVKNNEIMNEHQRNKRKITTVLMRNSGYGIQDIADEIGINYQTYASWKLKNMPHISFLHYRTNGYTLAKGRKKRKIT